MSNFDESVLFEIACTEDCSSWEAATNALKAYTATLPTGEDAALHMTLAVRTLQQYSTMDMPSSRQHILRLCRTFCPDLIETLPLKLDGASSAHQMEVLGSLEKKYGLVIGQDIQHTTDMVQHVLAQNRSLQVENEELREQLVQGAAFHEKFGEFMAAHQAVVKQLYEALASLQRANEEKQMLKAQLSMIQAVMPTTTKEDDETQNDANEEGCDKSREEEGEADQTPVNEELVEAKAKIEALLGTLKQTKAQHAEDIKARGEAELKREEEHLAAMKMTKQMMVDLMERGNKPHANAGVQVEIQLEEETRTPSVASQQPDPQSAGAAAGSQATPPIKSSQDTPTRTPSPSIVHDGDRASCCDGPNDKTMIAVDEVRPMLDNLRSQNTALKERLLKAQEVIQEYQNTMTSSGAPPSQRAPQVAVASSPTMNTPRYSGGAVHDVSDESLHGGFQFQQKLNLTPPAYASVQRGVRSGVSPTRTPRGTSHNMHTPRSRVAASSMSKQTPHSRPWL